jgi:heterodisulfide reductase subunit C
MKVKVCPACGERWWCVKCGYCTGATPISNRRQVLP